MKVILETERLRLREFTVEDYEFVIKLLNTPRWLQYIGDRNVKTKEQAVNYLTNGPIKSYQENGYGLSLVEKREGVPVGMCGIIKREGLTNPDIGFAFLPDFNRQGYAFEIASATMAYAKDRLHIPKISAITVPQNYSSFRLLERLGLCFITRIYLPNNSEELLLYEIEQ